jgi:alpha-beta hydrolase superfamily lysophospholipase
MTHFFKDKLHDEFGSWPLAYIPYGGADFGEIEAVAAAVGDGDDGAYYAAWNAAADRLAQEAASSLARGHRHSAKDMYLKATAFYAASYHPLYGEPVDPRLLAAFRKQVYTFEKALALFETPVEPVLIPLGEASMPAYLIPAQGREREVRPLVILTNGYDATITDMYFASAVAASRRGYHCLLFDGPGQGEMLYEHGVRLRPDWENVITPVVDFALEQNIVDPARIALSGWSLGGYLAPRAAAKEHRIAALIADPGTLSMAGGFRAFLINKLGVAPEAASDLGKLEQPLLDQLDAIVRADRELRWKVVQRGFWVHGVDNLRDYLAAAEQFTMHAHTGLIRCPTLLTMPENDPIAAATPSFFEALRCRKTLLCFSASEGAGEHCEMKNRSLLNMRILDWLDEQFAPRT